MLYDCRMSPAAAEVGLKTPPWLHRSAKSRCNHAAEKRSPSRSHATVKITYWHARLCSRPTIYVITACAGFIHMEFFALYEVDKQIEGWGDRLWIWKMPANIICFQRGNTHRRMSWRSYSPSWPYPPAAPVWGCPGGERGRSEKPHIRAIRLGTILLLSSKESGVSVGKHRSRRQKHTNTKKKHRRHSVNLNERFLMLRQKVGRVCANAHLYWCYLENLSLNPSTSPVNWCRGWWGFAAYFLLHWRRGKEPKSKHRSVRVRS